MSDLEDRERYGSIPPLVVLVLLHAERSQDQTRPLVGGSLDSSSATLPRRGRVAFLGYRRIPLKKEVDTRKRSC